MKRTLALVIAALVSTMGIMPADAEPRAKASRFCGDFCVQGAYKKGSLGSFFADDLDTMVHFGYEVVSGYKTFSQKKSFTYEVPDYRYIRMFEHSPDNSAVVFALDNGDVYLLDVSDGSVELVNETSIDRIAALAVSDDASRVFIAHKPSFEFGEPGVIDMYTNLEFDERYTNSGEDQGINVVELDPTNRWLYVGFLGASPTVVKVDTLDMSGGHVAEDSRSDLWSVTSIVVSPSGSVFAANSSHPASPADTDSVPTIIEFGGTNLNTLDYVELLDDWDGFKLALSDDGELLYSGASFDSANSTLGDMPNTITEYDATGLAVNRELELNRDGRNFMTMMDVDASGRYLLVSSDEFPTQLISLGNTRISPDVSMVDQETGNLVTWRYTYLNPKAKFKFFEVKYTPSNSRKAKIKRVTRAQTTLLPDITPGSDVSVRAVYSNKTYNSVWAVADLIL